MAYFTDEALAAAVEAMKPDRIQGFLYGTQNVIRDVYRPWASQVLWRGSSGTTESEEAFRRQCEIERLRIGFMAAAKVMAAEPVREMIAPLALDGSCFCAEGAESACEAFGCPRVAPSLSAGENGR